MHYFRIIHSQVYFEFGFSVFRGVLCFKRSIFMSSMNKDIKIHLMAFSDRIVSDQLVFIAIANEKNATDDYVEFARGGWLFWLCANLD